MAGAIAGELSPSAGEGEEAFIGAMFQNLGRLLVQFYFPEEASQVRKLVQSTRQPVTEAVASASVLGMTFEELGLGIAKVWGLPMSMLRCMRKPAGAVPSRAPADSEERIRWIALAANEFADVLLQSNPKDVDARLQSVTRKYMQVLGIGSKEIGAATLKARQKLVELAIAMEIRVAPGSAAANLLTLPDVTHHMPAPDPSADGDSGLAAFELHATNTFPVATGAFAPHKDSRVTDTLTAGIQDITNAMVDDFKLSDVLRMILETMFRAMHFDHIIFCMRDAKTDTLVGRFGLGRDVEPFVKSFKAPLKTSAPDLFSAVCSKGTDTLISDASQAPMLQRLPQWYRQGLNAQTFLLLPLLIKGVPFGLIYADKKLRGSLELDDKELALLRTLRNQAVMAFKQSS
jgi:hypothetical protein